MQDWDDLPYRINPKKVLMRSHAGYLVTAEHSLCRLLDALHDPKKLDYTRSHARRLYRCAWILPKFMIRYYRLRHVRVTHQSRSTPSKPQCSMNRCKFATNLCLFAGVLTKSPHTGWFGSPESVSFCGRQLSVAKHQSGVVSHLKSSNLLGISTSIFVSNHEVEQ